MIEARRSTLGSELEHAAELCTETLAEFAARYPAAERTPFANDLRLAVAAMETTVRQLQAKPSVRQSSLLITITLARQAAGSARRHGDGEELLRIAATCELVAARCEAALAER
jgi:hypothetical protein